MKRLARLPRLIASKLKPSHSLQKIGECNPGFQSREWRAQAGVDTVTKRQVRVGYPSHVKAIRVAEMLGITVRRANYRQD